MLYGYFFRKSKTGLLIFRVVAEPRNSQKHEKYRDIWYLIKYMYNIFETYFSYRSYLLAVNLQIYLGTLSLKRANRLCCKKLDTSHHVKGFAIGSFLERIVVERANDDLC